MSSLPEKYFDDEFMESLTDLAEKDKKEKLSEMNAECQGPLNEELEENILFKKRDMDNIRMDRGNIRITTEQTATIERTADH